jgi:DNA-binding response OmpR family regulator
MEVMRMDATVDVLVVDDEPDTLLLAQKILEMENFTVKTAPNGEEALRLIKKRGVIPRLMLLDVMMPKQDGFSVLQTLKSDDKYKSIIIILFTVKTFTKDIEHAKELGADGYIVKPFSGDKLIEQIKEKLGIE